MPTGADCIDDLDVVRCGGMQQLFAVVYAATTLGQLLREFTHGHSLQLASVPRAHLVNLIGCTGLLPGIEQRAFIDIDSLLRPVFGHPKQGASFGHTKIAGKQVLRKGLSPLVTTISTADGAPVIAGIRLRVRHRPVRARARRRWCARRSATPARPAAPADPGARRLGVRQQRRGARLPEGRLHVLGGARQERSGQPGHRLHPEDAWTPVHYPGAVEDPDTGALISDAEVAEVEFTAFTSKKKAEQVTARLIVRRVRDRAKTDELFPVWRYHPFFTNNTEPVAAADITHRRHAIIETVFADLIDGPLAHLPSGRFAANAAWATCAAMTHNLLRAAGTLTSGRHAVARGATLRRQIVTVPARLAMPQRRRVLHLPAHWPWAQQWTTLWQRVFGPATGPPLTA